MSSTHRPQRAATVRERARLGLSDCGPLPHGRGSLTAVIAAVMIAACLFAADEPAKPASQRLWPGAAPMATGETDRDIPSFQAYLPSKETATGGAVVVFPGGGYGGLAMGHEGHDIATWFNSMGVAAFVVKYRLGSAGYRHPVMILDAQRAIRTVRHRAAEFKIDPARIGVMGFSAGGHLCSTTLVHYDKTFAEPADDIDRVSARPDFGILCYPVITMDDRFTHGGSKANLLGKDPDAKLVELLSNEKQITKDTPPTFLFHTTEDKAVPAENSIRFYMGLIEAGVPAELHIYEKGRHGVGLAPDDAVLSSWPDRLKDWLKARGVLRGK